MKTLDIYEVIGEELDYQDAKWGGEEHDRQHPPHAFLLFMQHYMNRAATRLTTENNWDGGLEEMRKIVALGVACFRVHGVPKREV